MKKLLIVDDETSFLLSLQDGLQKYRDRFEVLTAEDGHTAIETLRDEPVDLLVTDLKLPGMNGFEILAWVSRHQPQLPVIVMSAFGTPEIEARLARMDTLQFLDKPLDLQVLEESIFAGLQPRDKSFIRGITLATFLQLMKAEKKTCTLKVTSEGQSAALYIRGGELIDAAYDDLSGLPAVLEIVSWNDAEIEMDGICRRQEDVIQMPMEQLLIEAFKRKDEAAEAAVQQEASRKARPHPAEPADPQIRALCQALNREAAVLEFALFNQDDQLECHNPGPCSLKDLHPEIFTSLLDPLPAEVNFGSFQSLLVQTSSRQRFLIFTVARRRVCARIKPGVKSAQLIRELTATLSAPVGSPP